MRDELRSETTPRVAESAEGLGGPLVGRQRELEALTAAVDAAAAGRGGVVALIGDQGMGKTTLAAEAAGLARARDVQVVWSRAWGGGGAPAYWMWVQVVRTLLGDLGEEFAAEFGDDAGLVAHVVPEVSKLTAAPAIPAPVARFPLFDAVARAVVAVSRKRPLLLVLDDLHAADEGSLLMLDFVARSARDGGLAILAAYSAVEAPQDLSLILASIASNARRIELAGLSRAEVARMYEQLAGRPPTGPMVAALHSATEGNPFFVEEAVRLATSVGDLHRPDHSLGFRVPEGVRDVVERRLARVPEDVVKVLGIASVIGREFDLATLQAVCDTQMDPLLEMLAEASKAKLVLEVGALGRYSFAHVLIRETLYETITAGDRMRLHRLIGDVLEERYRNDIESHLDVLAHHFFKAAQAGDPHKTFDYLARAASRARSLAAFEEAARLYSRAVKVAELAGISSARRAKLTKELEEVNLEARVSSAAVAGAKPSPSESRFRREGDYWTVVFEGTTSRIKDSKGLRYLSHLLVNPNREIHVLELVGAVEGNLRSDAVTDRDVPTSGSDDAGSVLDATAKVQYRRRIEELQEDIEEARRFNDGERAARAQEEVDALIEQLGAAMGLGGRDRKAASQTERARISVTKAVKSAITRMNEADPALGRHLARTIRTGIYCSYNPDPRAPISWTT